jgi:superfamily II DNA or RNA helicase
MQICSKDLPDLAGWKAVKQARILVSAGSVTAASIEQGSDEGAPCRLKGAVTEGRRRYVSGLIIHSLSEAENLCNCMMSRRDGQICQHSVAVALLALQESALKIDEENAGVTDSERETVNYTKLHWFPVPMFGQKDISERLLFPLKLCKVRGKERINDEIQNKIIEILNDWQIRFSESAQVVEIGQLQFLQLLSAFKGCVWKGDNVDRDLHQWSATRVAEIPARIPIRVSESSDIAGMVSVELPELPQTVLFSDGSDCWIFRHGDHLAIPTLFSTLTRSCREVLVALFENAAQSPRLEVTRKWLQNEVAQLNLVFHMECSEGLSESLRVVPGVPSVSLSVEGSLRQLDLKITFLYKAGEIANPQFHMRAFRMIGVVEWGSLKSPAKITDLSPSATELHPGWEESFKAKLVGEDAILAFYAGPLDKLAVDPEWNVDIGLRFTEISRDIEKVRPKAIALGQGNDWLSFDLKFTTDEGCCVPEKEIRRLLQTGHCRVKLPGGGRAAFDREVVESLFEVMGDADVEHDGNHNEGRTVRSANKLFFEEFADEFFDDDSLRESGEFAINKSSAFCGELRVYQKFGMQWLYSRASREHGAILADEMGLGKTVQILALVALLKGKSQGIDYPGDREELENSCIIICPTSLIKMWEQEIARFLPSKSVLVLQGPNRAKHFHDMASADLVITSYGALSRDVSNYPPVKFALAIADEASHLRNPKTQISRNISKISARARIALTGTPMENSIQDLWAIMNFANPGYLESREKFMALYGDGTAKKTRRLRRKLLPFMLRRTKADVATELPAKIERVLYCELSPEQRRVYEQVLNFSRNTFKNMGKSLTESSQRMDVLVLLLRLRQICCDLRLVDGGDMFKSLIPQGASDSVGLSRICAETADEAGIGNLLPRGSSAKLSTLHTLIGKSLAEGHKILIFSQFVSMLNFIREYLDSSGLKYCYLDGSQSVEQRGKQVQAFQSEEGLFPIFLMSLKAGGYGLTLTKADTVIHFDPWWNPAVEAQATDRAHRIGQTRTVTSYKLIASGSIEEKMLQLQDRKRYVADVALDDECPLMESLSNEDLEYILS